MAAYEVPLFSRRAGLACALLGGTGLLGWLTGWEWLKSVIPGLTAINPVTAICLLAGGAGWAAGAEAAVMGAGIGLALIGAVKLALLAHPDVDIDAWMFRHALDAYSPPNRMSPNAAAALVLTGLAMACARRPRPAAFSQGLALGSGCVSLFAFIGYAYRVRNFYAFGAFLPIALNTAAGLALLDAAVLGARPREGPLACVVEEGPAAVTARRLLPFTVLAPVLIGLAGLEGQRRGLYAPGVGSALTAAASVVMLTWLVWYNAKLVGALDGARQAAEETSRLLVENVRDYAIIYLDPEGIIRSWNAGAERLKGYKAAEVVGRGFELFYRPEDVAAGLPSRLLEQAARDGSVEHQGPRVRRDGSTFIADAVLTALRGADGRLRGFAKITRDLSERVLSEAALKENSERLEQSSRELDAFSYSVSHDLRAPLRAIDGFSQILLEDSADKLDDDGKDALRRVRAGCQRMGTLIDDLLGLSRIVRRPVQRETVDLSALARAVIEPLRAADPERKVDVVIAEGIVADADAGLMRIVLTNLIGNAWKFTSKTPGARLEFGREQGGGAPCCFVRDNGAGFDMAYANKLFGAFQRLHDSAEFPGTGVGLATVHRIVRRHGGKIWAQGKVGEGATFYFTLSQEEA